MKTEYVFFQVLGFLHCVTSFTSSSWEDPSLLRQQNWGYIAGPHIAPCLDPSRKRVLMETSSDHAFSSENVVSVLSAYCPLLLIHVLAHERESREESINSIGFWGLAYTLFGVYRWVTLIKTKLRWLAKISSLCIYSETSFSKKFHWLEGPVILLYWSGSGCSFYSLNIIKELFSFRCGYVLQYVSLNNS